MVLQIVTEAMLVICGASAIYSMQSSKPKHRRRVAQKISVLAVSGVLLSDTHTGSGWSHWMNLGVGVLGICSVVLQVVLDRRKMSRGTPVPEATASSPGGYKRPTGY